MKTKIIISALVFATLFSCQDQDSVELAIASVAKPKTNIDSNNRLADAPKLLWYDNFDGTDLNTDIWYRDAQATKSVKGADGLTYTLRTSTAPADSHVSQGSLKLEIRKHSATDYSRVWLRTKHAKAVKYGYYEAKIWMPMPHGFQGAFWMMPVNTIGMSCSSKTTCHKDAIIDSASDGAELDIIEGTGGQVNSDYKYTTNVHIDGYYVGHPSSQGTINTYNHTKLDPDNIYNRDHVYGFEWTSTFLKWYIDDVLVRTIAIDKWIPDVTEYVILSTSVNPLTWDGKFDASELPARMTVDWVRVWDKKPIY